MKGLIILSTPLVFPETITTCREITEKQAQELVNSSNVINYSGHQTTKILGIEPSKDRKVCNGYQKALSLKPEGRMEFGREYSLEEIKEIGVRFFYLEAEDI